MPLLHDRHNQFLGHVELAHARKDFAAMEAACRAGLELQTAPMLWAYNLACALALQGKQTEALAALDQAETAGYHDAEYTAQDPDLAALRELPEFQAFLARAARRPPDPYPDAAHAAAIPPDTAGTLLQTASNTFWNFQGGLFQTLVAAPPPTNPPPADFSGPEADAINAWIREGTASGLAPLLYINRDNGVAPPPFAARPDVTRVGYGTEVIERNLHLGLPNTLFSSTPGEDAFIPAIGHAELLTGSGTPFLRSLARAACNGPQSAFQCILMLSGQLHFYPAYRDYDLHVGDFFPAYQPAFVTVAGDAGAERPFMEAAAAALAAMRPEVRAILGRDGRLMPTLNMLLRASQRTVRQREDYLSPLAHPTVFLPENLDAARFVRMAHDLTPTNLPRLVRISVVGEPRLTPGVDFFDFAPSEQLFNSPFAIARVFRGAGYTHVLDVETHWDKRESTSRWIILRGDPARISLQALPSPATSKGSREIMRVSVSHHPPFDAPVAVFDAAAGTNTIHTIPSARVDIAMIVEADGAYSMPVIVSILFLGNENRAYGADGRILSIDYTGAPSPLADPLLSSRKNWKDLYQYDANGRFAGWKRIRAGGLEERFTLFGHRVTETDARGRATRAHIVRYMPRSTGEDGVTEVAQIDDNTEIGYSYASDADMIGMPEPGSIKQNLEPPEPAP
jgi:hypothetical protein